MSSSLQRCARHREVAGWLCGQCQRALCPQCAAPQVAHPTVLTRCLECGGYAKEIVRPRTETRSFVSRLGDVFTYAFRWPGVLVWAGLTLGAYVATLLCLGNVIAMTLTVVTAFALVRSAARGAENIDINFTNILDDLIWPTVRFALAMLPIWGPAYFLGDKLPGWAHLALDGFGVIWAPFSFIGAATQSPILSVLNPIVIANVARQVGRDAVTYILVSWAIIAVGAGLGVPATLILAAKLPLILSPLLALAIILWPVVTYGRLAGLVVYLHPEPFGGMADDGYEPVLGDTAPRGKWVERGAPQPKVPPADQLYRGSTSSAAFSVSSSSGVQAAPPPADVPPPELSPNAQFLQALASKNIDVLASLAKEPPLDLSIKEYLQAGRLLAAQQRNTEAEYLLERAAGRPGEPVEQAEARVIWARFLAERSGAPDMAKEWFVHVVNTFPETAAARFAQRWLDAHP